MANKKENPVAFPDAHRVEVVNAFATAPDISNRILEQACLQATRVSPCYQFRAGASCPGSLRGQSQGETCMKMVPLITFRVEPNGLWQFVKGRNAWALSALVTAGKRGVTPIDVPGPRWSAYVFNLRAMGICIETIHEAHGGAFPGTHARYVLRSTVTLSNGEENVEAGG